MTQSLTIIEGPGKKSEEIAGSIGTKREELRGLSKAFIGKTFSRKRVRANAVYALLIASIFLTLLSAIVTCSEIRAKDVAVHKDVALADPSLLLHDSNGFNPVRFSSFVIACADMLACADNDCTEGQE